MRDCPCGMVVFNRCLYQPVRHSVIKITMCVRACVKTVVQVFISSVKMSWVRILSTVVPRFPTYNTVNFYGSTGSERASFSLNQSNITNEVSCLHQPICAARKSRVGDQLGMTQIVYRDCVIIWQSRTWFFLYTTKIRNARSRNHASNFTHSRISLS